MTQRLVKRSAWPRLLSELQTALEAMPLHARIDAINQAKLALHTVSPFAAEPVDCVLWVKAEQVQANDYNPNSVAPPEMRLLEHSITEDGYTQPIVAWQREDIYEVIDGFHRNRVGRETSVRDRVYGYLPVTAINEGRQDKGDRIAATIRHNRARGKHRVDSMSEIIVELKRRNWSDEKIGRELGMDPDEILRLTQISGLAEMFIDREFSTAWEADQIDETDDLNDEAQTEAQALPIRTVGRLQKRNVPAKSDA